MFDEAHYISDPDRGVVWEESIILLPNQVRKRRRFSALSSPLPDERAWPSFCVCVSDQHRDAFSDAAQLRGPL